MLIAQKAIEDISTKLFDLGNVERKIRVAEVALAKFNDVLAKYMGLRLAAELASGGMKEPADSGYFAFAPAQKMTWRFYFPYLTFFGRPTKYFAENQ